MPRLACNAARSLHAAERRALTGENDSQDSQEKLLFLIQEHGVGVTTSSPTPDDEPRLPIKGPGIAPTSRSVFGGGKHPRQPHLDHFENASSTSASSLNITNADVGIDVDVGDNTDTDIDVAAVAAFTSPLKRPSRRLQEPISSAPVASPNPAVSIPAQSSVRDARPVGKPPSPQTRDDAIRQPLLPTALSKKRARKMDSQSPTQTNEGRSYEQYTCDASQPSSPPRSFAEEHRTLQEGDTGYVDFQDQFELPDTAPVEPDTPLPRSNDRDRLSQFTSQLGTTRTDRFAPETPAPLPKPFLSGGNGQVMPASELFGQTQPTSGLRKASPTSSRPSPNVFENNVTSPTHPTSSPLKNRGFGTSPLPTYVSTSPAAAERTRPLGRTPGSPSLSDALGAAEGQDEDEIDKTPLPKLKPRRVRSGLEPIDEYQPYRKQVLDSETTKSSSQRSLDSDFERDVAELRRQRAKSNKERASRSFPEITVPPPGSDGPKVEVPSTNRAKRSRDLAPPNSEEHTGQHRESYAANDNTSQDTVADSQDVVVEQQKSTSENDKPVLPARGQNESVHQDSSRPTSAAIENGEDKDMIPETSPAPTFTEPPRLIGDIMRDSSSAPSGLTTLSYPIPSAGTFVELSNSLDRPNQMDRTVSAPPVSDKGEVDSIIVASSPSVVLASSQRTNKRRSGRLNSTATPSSTAPQALLPSDAGTTSSSLTVLPTTPAISSSLTPHTEDSHGAELPDDTVSVPSPTVERGRRPRRPPSSLPDPSPSSTRPNTYRRPRKGLRKGTRQSSRHSSLSLDELSMDISPNPSASEDARVVTRKPPRKSTTLREFQTKRGIFEGMVFAISFQERQQPQRCRDKLLSKRSLEEMIRQEGGRILDDGFSALFEFDTLPTSAKATSTSVLSNSLNLLDAETGFTALIADGHSRKVKYMQALALGIPCLAPKWVATCVSKKEIVDWSSYLLCAGSSSLLGDAIRSRILQPYDASTARLAQVISHRPKLLDESKILLIMKKTKNEEKRLPYVFLAQALGASLVRVHSVEEARAKLREAESVKDTFNWVYVDDHLENARVALFGSAASEGAAKKRKRTSMGSEEGDRPPKRIRTLNDELVIQSLILGRLVEEDEMEG